MYIIEKRDKKVWFHKIFFCFDNFFNRFLKSYTVLKKKDNSWISNFKDLKSFTEPKLLNDFKNVMYNFYEIANYHGILVDKVHYTAFCKIN